MDKKKVWLLGILISVLITATLFVISLAIGGSGRTGTDSPGFSFASFFIIFILPSIIARQNQKKKQEELQHQQKKKVK